MTAEHAKHRATLAATNPDNPSKTLIASVLANIAETADLSAQTVTIPVLLSEVELIRMELEKLNYHITITYAGLSAKVTIDWSGRTPFILN